jgi:hypothetical protein
MSRAIQNLPPALRDYPVRVRTNSPRGKISEALKTLIAPLVDPEMTIHQYRAALGIGATAWNHAILDEPPTLEFMDSLKDLGADERAYVLEAIALLVPRKQRLFPHDDRMVVSWEATASRDGGFHIQAGAISAEP